jgi:heterodisulfide reductase subunit B
MSTEMRYAYFPGCSSAGTSISFTYSADYVADKIGLELLEIPDWNCCGTSAALVTDRNLALALPARSLAIAENDPKTAGLTVATPCAGCYASLKATREYVVASDAHRKHVEEMIEQPYSGSADVVSFLELMSAPETAEIIHNAIIAGNKSLDGLKVACYYGCALVRPNAVTRFDDVENPQSMDNLMALAGAEPVEWAFKTECCGASHQMTEPKAARQLIERIFADAAANGAEVIVSACPLCMLNLDMRESEINKQRSAAGKPTLDLPVFYFTELLGLVLGGGLKELGINRHFHPATRISERVATRTQEAAPQEAAPQEAAPQEVAPSETKEVAV